jgi:hypothetical protein
MKHNQKYNQKKMKKKIYSFQYTKNQHKETIAEHGLSEILLKRTCYLTAGEERK